MHYELNFCCLQAVRVNQNNSPSNPTSWRIIATSQTGGQL